MSRGFSSSAAYTTERRAYLLYLREFQTLSFPKDQNSRVYDILLNFKYEYDAFKSIIILCNTLSLLMPNDRFCVLSVVTESCAKTL